MGRRQWYRRRDSLGRYRLDKRCVEAVKKSLHATAVKEKMKVYEKPANVYLTADEWTVDSGLVTAAMKLKRAEIQKKYKTAIDEQLFPPIKE